MNNHYIGNVFLAEPTTMHTPRQIIIRIRQDSENKIILIKLFLKINVFIIKFKHYIE